MPPGPPCVTLAAVPSSLTCRLWGRSQCESPRRFNILSLQRPSGKPPPTPLNPEANDLDQVGVSLCSPSPAPCRAPPYNRIPLTPPGRDRLPQPEPHLALLMFAHNLCSSARHPMCASVYLLRWPPPPNSKPGGTTLPPLAPRHALPCALGPGVGGCLPSHAVAAWRSGFGAVATAEPQAGRPARRHTGQQLRVSLS